MNRFIWWIPFAIITTGFCGLVLVTTQQVYRQNANDPQIQMSEDIALALSNGAGPGSVVPQTKVDMAFSLAPVVMIYDSNGKLVASNATLNGSTVVVPSGVITYTKLHQQDRVTWQPERGVRSALVVTEYNAGYVAVSRSLREVEKRIDALTKMVIMVWVLATGGTFALFAIMPLQKKKK